MGRSNPATERRKEVGNGMTKWTRPMKNSRHALEHRVPVRSVDLQAGALEHVVDWETERYPHTLCAHHA